MNLHEDSSMKDWTNPNDRKAGTENFCRFLHDPANLEVRKQCTIRKDTTDPTAAYAKAKKVFAEQGGFVREEDVTSDQDPKKAIPKAVEFRVYEETDILPRDNLVTMVLPRPDQPLPNLSVDVRDVYRCTWSPWATLVR
jgi:hypothetical protein